MEFWQAFWAVFLLASVGLFAILAVVVSAGGLSDILALFKSIGCEDSRGDGAGEKGDAAD